MDEAHVVAREPAQAPEVEVERVEEAGRRPGRDAVDLDDAARDARAPRRARAGTGARRPSAAARTRGRARDRRHRAFGSGRERRPRSPSSRAAACRRATGTEDRPANRHAETVARSAASTSRCRISFAYLVHVRLRSTVSRARCPRPVGQHAVVENACARRARALRDRPAARDGSSRRPRGGSHARSRPCG